MLKYLKQLLNPSHNPNDLWYSAAFPHTFALIMRVFVSLFMIHHGYPKLEKFIAGGDIQFYDFIGMGPKISLALCILGELVAPIFIILGYQTRFAAFLVWFTMAVAAYGAHANDPIDEKEMSLLYFVIFAGIAKFGPGKYSIDYYLQSKKAT